MPQNALKCPQIALKYPQIALKYPQIALKYPQIALKCLQNALKCPQIALKCPTIALKCPKIAQNHGIMGESWGNLGRIMGESRGNHGGIMWESWGNHFSHLFHFLPSFPCFHNFCHFPTILAISHHFALFGGILVIFLLLPAGAKDDLSQVKIFKDEKSSGRNVHQDKTSIRTKRPIAYKEVSKFVSFTL